MSGKRNRPEFCTDDMLEYLDDLRESGQTNMFGAGKWIRGEFPNLSRKQAKQVVLYWMNSFEDRHPR